MSGFGRCGEWFAVQRHGVTPDIIATAKGITGGYIPLGAVIISDKIAEYYTTTALPCGLTYSAHALACAAGLACIKEYQDKDLIAAANIKGSYLEKKCKALQEKHPSIGDVRFTGMLGWL
jgi:taurine--2-oxoglutarate transaminase